MARLPTLHCLLIAIETALGGSMNSVNHFFGGSMRKVIILIWVALLAGVTGTALADEKGKATSAPVEEIAVIETKFGNIEL